MIPKKGRGINPSLEREREREKECVCVLWWAEGVRENVRGYSFQERTYDLFLSLSLSHTHAYTHTHTHTPSILLLMPSVAFNAPAFVEVQTVKKIKTDFFIFSWLRDFNANPNFWVFPKKNRERCKSLLIFGKSFCELLLWCAKICNFTRICARLGYEHWVKRTNICFVFLFCLCVIFGLTNIVTVYQCWTRF